MDTDFDNIRAVARGWAVAVRDSDVATLRDLMTDDVVVIHGNGRMVQGRDAVAADLESGLARVSVIQQVESKEIIVAGEWAIDRSEVRSNVTPRSGGETEVTESRTLTVLHRDAAMRWRVARTMGVVRREGN